MNAVVAELSGDVCTHCLGLLRVWNKTLRRAIRCTRCTVVPLPYEPDALKRLARRERKRLRAQVAVVVVETIAEQLTRVFPRVPPELVMTDRVLDRWAAFGTGMPASDPDLYATSLPPPLDPDTQSIVTDCIYRAHDRERALIIDLYGSPKFGYGGAGMAYLARKFRMSPRNFGRLWHQVLRDQKAMFLASNHSDLVSLINVPP